MSRATPKLLDLAARLIVYEAKISKSSGTSPLAAFPVTEKLRPHLATLMGTLGFRALLTRSLALAGAEVPWLRTLKPQVDG